MLKKPGLFNKLCQLYSGCLTKYFRTDLHIYNFKKAIKSQIFLLHLQLFTWFGKEELIKMTNTYLKQKIIAGQLLVNCFIIWKRNCCEVFMIGKLLWHEILTQWLFFPLYFSPYLCL